jgi:hypothetical protein
MVKRLNAAVNLFLIIAVIVIFAIATDPNKCDGVNMVHVDTTTTTYYFHRNSSNFLIVPDTTTKTVVE